MFQWSCAGSDRNVAQRQEVRSLVSSHQLDGIHKDLNNQKTRQIDDDETEKSSCEKMNWTFTTISIYNLSWFCTEQPEHNFSNQDDQWRNCECKCVEQWVRNIDIEVFWHKIRFIEMNITAVEYTMVVWKDAGESQVVPKCSKTSNSDDVKNGGWKYEIVYVGTGSWWGYGGHTSVLARREHLGVCPRRWHGHVVTPRNFRGGVVFMVSEMVRKDVES